MAPPGTRLLLHRPSLTLIYEDQMSATTDDDAAAPDPDSVLAAFGLRGPATAVTAVGGAWSNRVYRLDAATASFALKELLNPWAEPRWAEWLGEALSFEQRAIAAGVAAPAPVPNPADGGCLAWVTRRGGTSPAAVRLHRWVDGEPFGAGPVQPDVAAWAGEVLATLHGLGIRPRDRSLFPVPDTSTASRWPELTDAARRSGAEWADQLAEIGPAVSILAELALQAGHRPEQEVMTHGDIDQKNLIATPHGPVLCDWDVAVPLVPRRELADVALSLGCWEAFDIARDVVRSYRQAGGDDTAFEPADLGQPMMIGLDWVAFNVERAIGLRPSGPAGSALAQGLVPELLAAVPRGLDVALRIARLMDP